MGGAVKDRSNPHFRAEYATLASVIDAGRASLASNGLACVQGLSTTADGLLVTTRLVHASGEWIEDELCVPLAKRDAQGMGSAATYGRRYALAALLGIAQVDDDGNAAAGGAGYVAPEPEPEPPAELVAAMRDAAMGGTVALRDAYKALDATQRKAVAKLLDSLKAAAVKADARPVPEQA